MAVRQLGTSIDGRSITHDLGARRKSTAWVTRRRKSLHHFDFVLLAGESSGNLRDRDRCSTALRELRLRKAG